MYVCVCVGVGKPPPKTQPPPNVNWWAGRGRANETENAVLILISAHVEKRGKTAKAANVKGEQRKILAVEERSIRGKVGKWYFCGTRGRET